MSVEDLDGASGYRRDFPYHDENLLMLGWYARRLEATLRRRGARRVLSLGVGHRVVSRRLGGLLGAGVDSYTIVEGSAARIEELRQGEGLPAGRRRGPRLLRGLRPAVPGGCHRDGFRPRARG